MKKILSWPLFYPLILVILCLFIALKNHTPGTFLTGWDTLHPEFNFKLNFNRLIFGVWRSDQGLGDLSGHSAMADLPRLLILWLFHFIFSLSFLRYSYIFLCLVIGPLGFYFLANYLFKKSPYHQNIAFLSALFYLFNLGTLQQFFVPFEMFPTQWAFLPLLILFSLKYLHSQKTTYLIIYLLFTFFASPQAYAAQLWYAFFAVYTLFLILYTLLHRNNFRITFNLLIITLLVNSFWLLPNIYYALTSTQNPLTNKSNRLYSQEYLLQNRATGTLANTSLIKGFYFNWNEYNFQRKSSQNLTETWNQHLQKHDVLLIGNLLFILSFTGLLAAFYQKNKLFLSLTPFFIVPFFLLANSTPLIRIPFDLLLKINLFQELFRFIFTKVSILFTFGVVLFFAFTLDLFFSTISRLYLKIFSLILTISLLIYCFPYFQGQLISPIVRIKIPQNYFNLQQFLQKQNDGRILSLPLHEFSGWQYYNWHYQGSGFIWFGFPQSILDRDSDRWELKNEQAYREFFYTLYSKNQPQFYNTLLKYQVQYLLWDQSIIPASPKNIDQITFKYETEKILNNLISENKITLLSRFDSVLLYRVNQTGPLVQLQNIHNFVAPSYDKHYWDLQYTGQDYLTTWTSQDQNFSFRNVLNNTENFNFHSLSPDEYHPLSQYSATNLYNLNPSNQNLKLIDSQSLQISSLNSVQGLQIQLDTFPHNQSYVLAFRAKYLSGLPLRFCLRNSYTNLCVLEDQLSKNTSFETLYFLVPPMDEYTGYTLDINTISFASVPSVSQIESIDIYSLNNRLFTSTPSLPNQNYPLNYKIIFPNYSLIKTTINPDNPAKYLTFYQSFQPGWLAFSLKNGKINFLKNHLLINNWANAWELPQNFSGNIYILFWPQLLQFLGFGFLIIILFWQFFFRFP